MVAERIRNDYKGEKYWTPPFDIFNYYSNYQPTVYFAENWKINVAAYMAGGSTCEFIKDAKYIVTDVTKPFNSTGFEKLGEPIPGKEVVVQIWRKR